MTADLSDSSSRNTDLEQKIATLHDDIEKLQVDHLIISFLRQSIANFPWSKEQLGSNQNLKLHSITCEHQTINYQYERPQELYNKA